MSLPDLRRVLGAVSLATGLALSARHPVAPLVATLAYLGFLAWSAWRPTLALVCLPLWLPVLDFSPWTGWLIVDEFDLLVLAVVAAGYLRAPAGEAAGWRPGVLIALLLIARGAYGLTAPGISAYADDLSPLNALRIGKSLLWLALLFPLTRSAWRSCARERVTARFFAACLSGSGFVVLAVLWERGFYPGLFDLSTPYRTVALFWEMHRGGAALDAYLVLLAPLLVWAWCASTSSARRLALGAFILLFVYVCLTTFSRGVLGAIAGAMVVLAALFASRRRKSEGRWPELSVGGVAMVLLLAVEVGLVLGAGSFMGQRLAASERDFGGRLVHWRRGLSVLETPADWLFGVGLGQYPRRLRQAPAGPARPGAFFWPAEGGPARMLMAGPDLRGGQALGGVYAISQRVDLIPGQPYRLSMDLRSDRDAQILVELCAQHLLYPSSCQKATLHANSDGWRRVATIVRGPPLAGKAWLRAGHGVFLLSVTTPGAEVYVGGLQLAEEGRGLLRNGQFGDQAAGWFPVARNYFLPWHIDNLYLELLIETGIVGLLLFVAALASLLWRLFLAHRRGNGLAAYCIASISGVLALGLVVSLLDMPRVATLFGLFLAWAWHGAQPPGPGQGLAAGPSLAAHREKKVPP